MPKFDRHEMIGVLTDTSVTLLLAANDLIYDNLRAGAEVQFTIPTRSMLPTLAPGTVVRVRGIPAAEACVGDIVMLRAGERWLTHRLIGRQVIDGTERLLTQGDNLARPDAPWSSEQLCGKIASVKRRGVEQSLESKRARWAGAVIARLLRQRSSIQSSASGLRAAVSLRINAVLVRVAAWFTLS